ncbi:MAG: deoxynucleoside kinase [Bacteroidetes bacterium]|nr:deoxynucleoside kinase [Bacteroidota bacterium]
MQCPFPYSFIAFEGNIGAGKTTLCERLAHTYGCALVLEQFTDNPFLPRFYEQPERYGFPVELFFMTERHKQLQEHFSSPDLFRSCTLADYVFLKTLLFANKNLQKDEFRLFQRLFHVLNAGFPKPDLLVYLHRPLEVLLHQIQKRGRDMEYAIQPDYLLGLQSAYFEFLKTETEIPVLILDLGDLDFQQNEDVFNQIVHVLVEKHASGLQFRSLTM